MFETNSNTSIEDINGLASRVGSLIGILETIIGGDSTETSPVEIAIQEDEPENDPLQQLRDEIARQGTLIEKQIRQREILNSRMDYLADKIAQLQGAKHMNADNPDFQDCAHLASGEDC